MMDALKSKASDAQARLLHHVSAPAPPPPACPVLRATLPLTGAPALCGRQVCALRRVPRGLDSVTVPEYSCWPTDRRAAAVLGYSPRVPGL